jgi:hypothetical protein
MRNILISTATVGQIIKDLEAIVWKINLASLVRATMTATTCMSKACRYVRV